MKVYCVWCDDVTGASIHIFSTMDKAEAFCNSDPRDHVIYDYVVDCPERMEQIAR